MCGCSSVCPNLERRVDRKRSPVGFLRGFRFPELSPTQGDHVPIGSRVDARLDHLAEVCNGPTEVPQLRSSEAGGTGHPGRYRQQYMDKSKAWTERTTIGNGGIESYIREYAVVGPRVHIALGVVFRSTGESTSIFRDKFHGGKKIPDS